MDLTEIRNQIIELYSLKNTNSEYNFFYDETNNIRKFYLKENNFNESAKSNFVLGGICYENTKYNLSDLFKRLNLQANITEVKLKHIATGDFFDCIKSKKLRTFLDGLSESDLYIHYSVLNFLYFSIVDIIDSAEAGAEIENDFFENRKMKDMLYQIVQENKERFIKLFFDYDYPNVKIDVLDDFVQDFANLVESADNQEQSITNRLTDLLQKASENKSLPFITDEKNYVLIDNFSHFYIRSVMIFVNSTHTFDREDTIVPLVKELDVHIEGAPLNNFNFIDSHDNLYIQTSDIFIGLLGKYFDFLAENSFDEIVEFTKNLDDVQYSNLELLVEIVNKSNKKNKAFIHSTTSNIEMKKDAYIQKYFDLI